MKQFVSSLNNLIQIHKNVLFFVGLLLIPLNIIFTTYSILTSTLAEGVEFSSEKFALLWSSGSAGTFFPWPQPSGFATVLTYSYDLVDIIIWFSATSGMLLVLSVLFWIISASLVILPTYYSLKKD